MAYARNQLRLVVVGHVDHGKSTLIGRLFYDTGSLPAGKYEQLVAIAQRRGVPFEFANLMDALQAERDQNITIDTSQIWFRTPKREYVIIDAPGHKEFVKNMVTGAARADAALIIIDASEGVQEQTRRHGYLLRLIGVRQVVIVVNKMDLVDYSQKVFEQVSSEYRAFLSSHRRRGAGLHSRVGAPGRQHRRARREPRVVQRARPCSKPSTPSLTRRKSRISRCGSPSRMFTVSITAASSPDVLKQGRYGPATNCCFFRRAAPAWCDRSSAGTRLRSSR